MLRGYEVVVPHNTTGTRTICGDNYHEKTVLIVLSMVNLI